MVVHYLIIACFRCVVEFGNFVKHLKVEVYLIDLKLCVHPNINDYKTHSFSRLDTISKNNEKAYNICSYDTDDILTVMKERFSIPDTTECRLWKRYMTGRHELLTNLQQTVYDAGLYGSAGLYGRQVSS